MSDQVSPPPGYVMIDTVKFVELCEGWIADGDFHHAQALMDVTEGEWSSGFRRRAARDTLDVGDDGQSRL